MEPQHRLKERLTPTPSSRPCVFVLVTHGFHIRNVLCSDILPTLATSAQVVLIVPAGDVFKIRAVFGGSSVTAEPIPGHSERLHNLLGFCRRYVFTNPKWHKNVSVFSMDWKSTHPVRAAILQLLNRTIGRFQFIRRSWLAAEALFISGHEYRSLFRKWNPDLVVSCAHVTSPDEISLIRFARSFGSRTAAIVPSWDNLSTKGSLGAHPDKLIVWNEIMREEAQEFHDFPANDVVALGAPQFDAYFRPIPTEVAEELKNELGAPNGVKTLLIGTITPKYFAHNLEIVEILANAIRDNKLSQPCRVVVRLHPQVVAGGTHGDKLEDYLAVAKDNPAIKIDVPKTVNWGTTTSPSQSDSAHLGALMRSAAVMIHPGSTLSVDAAAVDCPVIGLGFDGYATRPYGQSIRRWWDFSYQQPVLASGGIRITNSPQELIDLVNLYLENPAQDAQGRARIRAEQCQWTDGQSGKRIGDFLLKMAMEGALAVRETRQR